MPEAWPGDVVEPMSKMRQLISDHMVMSRRTSAHVTSFFEIDLTRVARIRATKRAEFEAHDRPEADVPAVHHPGGRRRRSRRIRSLNASVAGNNVIYRKQYNIGIAVALDWGLIVPVIKHAEDLSLVGLDAGAERPRCAGRTSACSPRKCRTARSRSRTRACSARSWARRSSTSRRWRSWASARSRSVPRCSPGRTARTRSRFGPARTSRSRSITG